MGLNLLWNQSYRPNTMAAIALNSTCLAGPTYLRQVGIGWDGMCGSAVMSCGLGMWIVTQMAVGGAQMAVRRAAEVVVRGAAEVGWEGLRRCAVG